jgi:hypothetical protein
VSRRNGAVESNAVAIPSRRVRTARTLVARGEADCTGPLASSQDFNAKAFKISGFVTLLPFDARVFATV